MTFEAAYLSGPNKLELKQVEMPEINDEQVLIKVKASGICGSDLECYTGHSKEGRYDIAPYIPGHEWSGEVVEMGKNVSSLKKGDKVTSDCVLACGKCANCKSGLHTASCENMREVGFMPNSPGGMGEYFALDEKYLHKLPDDMSFEEGALVEPFSVSYFGIWGQGGHVDASDDVVVYGAGPIGLFAAAIAAVAGAKVIVVEPIENRRQVAMKLGATDVIDPKTQNVKDTVWEMTEGRGADLVVEAAGEDEAIASCFEAAGHNGRIRLIGHSIGRKVPAEIGLTIWKALSVQGQAGSPFFFPRTIRFMSRAKKRIPYWEIITHKFTLGQVQEAFDFALKEREETIKALITM